MNQNKPSKQIFSYSWVIIGISFLMIFANYGFCSSNRGLYLTAITEALDMKRSVFSISDTCRYAATSLVSIFFGSLLERFGTRKLLTAGYVCLIGFAVCYALGTNIFIFCLGSALLGIGVAWTTTTMVGSIINKWCTKNKGTIMGVVLSANGLGGAVAAQIITPLIFQEGNPFGYRNAYWLVAGILLVIGLAAILLYKDNPVPITAPAEKKKKRGTSWSGPDIQQLKKKTYYYGTVLTMFLTGLGLTISSGTSTAYFQDIGMDPAVVASILSVSSLALTGSKFLAGFLYDRLGLKITVTICNIAAILASLALWITTDTPVGIILAFAYAIVSAVSLPMQTIMLPILANDMFGNRSGDRLSGLLTSACTAGFAIGGPLINFVYDRVGTYKPTFPICAILMFIVTVVLLCMIRTAEKERSHYE